MTADTDISDIVSYLIDQGALSTVRRYAAKIDADLELLSQFPRIGSPRPNLAERVRIGVIDPYVIVYEELGNAVTILRVLHGRCNIDRDLLR